MNKVLHQPLQALKAAAREGDSAVVEAVQQIFGISSQGGGLARKSVALAPPIDSAPEKETAAEAAEREAFEASRH
jgi:hypothetical protein